MSEAQGTAVPSIPVIFPEETQILSCTHVVCSNGHTWIPPFAMAKCGFGTPQGWNGCGSPVVAIKANNCPVCNEPSVKLRLRVDYTPPVPYPSPLCIPGSKSHAETLWIETDLKHSITTEAIELAKIQGEQPNGKE